MVRSIVGTMLEIGLRKIHPEDIHQIIQSRIDLMQEPLFPPSLFFESVNIHMNFN